MTANRVTASHRRLLLALLWAASLAIAGWAISQRLELSGDLRKFMPAQGANEQPGKPSAARAAGRRAAAASGAQAS